MDRDLARKAVVEYNQFMVTRDVYPSTDESSPSLVQLLAA